MNKQIMDKHKWPKKIDVWMQRHFKVVAILLFLFMTVCCFVLSLLAIVTAFTEGVLTGITVTCTLGALWGFAGVVVTTLVYNK